MHAFIITGGSVQSRAEYVESLSSLATELIHLTAEKSSITIKQIQSLSEPLAISPRLPRLVWVEEADSMTVPAQNALLKMLEEPPVDTSFYLTCRSSNTLLPTIRSRSKVVQLEHTQFVHNPAILADLKKIMALSPGDRLASIVKRDRAESLAWLSQIELSLSEKLKGQDLGLSSSKMLAGIAALALSAHRELLANCNVTLVIQNFYLTLPHTHSARVD